MNFNTQAQGYHLHATPQRRFAEALAAFSPFNAGDRVTELGAGTGFLTRALLSQGAMVDASDASPAMVEIGKQSTPTASWTVANAFTYNTPCHHLASNGMLQWAPDPGAVLSLWHACLPSDGRLLLGVLCEPGFRELRSLTGEGPIRWRDEAEWLKLLRRAGFNVRTSAVYEHQEYYPTAIDFLRQLHETGVTGEPRYSASELRSLLREYDRLFPAPSGKGVRATWAWLMVEAVC